MKSTKCKRIIIVSHPPLKTSPKKELKTGKKIMMLCGHRHKYGLWVSGNNGISLRVNSLYVDPIIPIVEVNENNFEVRIETIY